jgi:hypothetical protein
VSVYEDDEFEGYETPDTGEIVDYDEAREAWQDAYDADPVGLIGQVIERAAGEVAGQIAGQVEAEAQQARAERSAANVREAADAMAEKYGQGWEQNVPTLADALREDAQRGVLPTGDALQLARHVETRYLAERERSRPSKDAENRAYWQAVQDLAERERNPWTR